MLVSPFALAATGALLVHCGSANSSSNPGDDSGVFSTGSGSGGSRPAGTGSGTTGSGTGTGPGSTSGLGSGPGGSTDAGNGSLDSGSGGDDAAVHHDSGGADDAHAGGDSGHPSGGDAGKSTTSRPSYNTGNGFYVNKGVLYDANGEEFRLRGVDRCHYDSDSQPGISKSGANSVRIFVYTNNGQTVADLVKIVQTQHIDYKEVPIITAPMSTSGTGSSCSNDPAVLSNMVANWVATAPSWTPLDKYSIINIANEWGPSNSTVWRDSYISAIASMRAAGYLGTLLIDTGGCGQDINDLATYSGAVFDSDPQKNVMFAFHAYGATTPANVGTLFAQLGGLGATTGAAYAVPEFGPGNNIGPSPTMVTPAEIITNAEMNKLGWLGWAWDDNNLGGGMSNNSWFSMTLTGPGIYTQASDLTTFGQEMVLNSTYGLSVLAKPASIF